MSVVAAAAVVLTASPMKGGVPTLLLLAALIVASMLWWFFLRRRGQRGNNYDPLKTDIEAARTPFAWKEEGRYILMFIVIMAPIQFSSTINSWKFAWLAGGFTFIMALWSMSHEVWRPIRYTPIPAIAKAHPDLLINEPDAWLLGYMYASKLCPGGRQIRSDILKESLAEWGWEPDEVDHAIATLCNRGEMVRIRELRSLKDGADAVNWLTITELGRENFKARYPVGNNRAAKETHA